MGVIVVLVLVLVLVGAGRCLEAAGQHLPELFFKMRLSRVMHATAVVGAPAPPAPGLMS